MCQEDNKRLNTRPLMPQLWVISQGLFQLTAFDLQHQRQTEEAVTIYMIYYKRKKNTFEAFIAHCGDLLSVDYLGLEWLNQAKVSKF